MTKAELLKKANSLPLQPGVYLMMDADGVVIYVGKAKKLKNRVSQYFQETSSHNAKTKMMVSSVNTFDTIVVRSEFEALVLENSLIKRHMPRFNILLKDDKGYPFVRVDEKSPYPRMTLSNQTGNDGARYFGPFGGRQETRAALDALLSALQLPTCRKVFPRDIGKERPCLNYHMGRCRGYCTDERLVGEYAKSIRQAILVLEGLHSELLKQLEQEMTEAAEALQFERAAQLRDQRAALEALKKKQIVIAGICADTDVWGIAHGAAKSAYVILHMQEGNLAAKEYEVFAPLAQDNDGEILSSLLLQYYGSRNVFPKEILIPCVLEDQEVLQELFAEQARHKVTVHVPQRGEKATLMDVAKHNAEEEIERITTAQERTNQTLELLQKMLKLKQVPLRMESYDISNTGKSDIVASMVVYEGGKPKKKDYRRFMIKSLSAPDDYRSMQEVLERRMQRFADGDEKFSPLPDVFLIDGGQEHAKVAEEVVRSFHCQTPVFGMVKDGHHHTRALMTPYGEEIGIQSNPSVFSLIGQIQEETHRFAITYHHEKHQKSIKHSLLDDVKGLGEKRKKLLRKKYPSMKAMKEASLEELEAVLPKDVALRLKSELEKEKV